MRTIGLVVSLLLIPAVGHAQFHCVNPTGSGGRFSSIQAAIDAARTGGNVFVSTACKAKVQIAPIIGGVATETGGGIYSAGKLQLVNVTLSGNDASADGGGMYMEQGRAKVTASTIVSNSAGIFGGEIAADTSPRGKRAVVPLRTTIVGDNIDIGGDSDCVTIGKGRIGSWGGNLLENCSPAKPKPTDLVGVDPMLAPLDVDGLHFPLPGSPVLGALNR